MKDANLDSDSNKTIMKNMRVKLCSAKGMAIVYIFVQTIAYLIIYDLAWLSKAINRYNVDIFNTKNIDRK
jgi:hypothetical protein